MTSSESPIQSRKIAEAARLLIDARRARQPIQAPPSELAPADDAEAWAIHEAVVASFGPVVAWKTGAPSPEAEPGMGLITADTLKASPAAVPADAFVLGAVEAEIAVTLARDLGPRPEPYSADEVLDAVATWHAAIEVLDTAFADWAATPALWKIADRQSHGLLVLGAGVTERPKIPLARLPVRLTINGETAFAHEGGNSGGDPARLLTHLANARRATDRPLLKGDVVTTGSTTPFRRATPGQSVRASFEGLPDAELTIAAA
ncbi:2-keto-4-pentenoate hydratase [Hansschlegelia sp.]|uniref:2-keto-4-pentenoate hydratase n=1 Tax=Hansschlegelia sp. TaxID=2041892 RepID=UPI002C305D7C|nr:fumarylacetoacetate hydrolase family protein [Hansschlegelia sp.]HVI28897.1 fumarylacetoacetate hydrolase family protein [Hansschlegelia sp.]